MNSANWIEYLIAANTLKCIFLEEATHLNYKIPSPPTKAHIRLFLKQHTKEIASLEC